jgi:hypothetical protein
MLLLRKGIPVSGQELEKEAKIYELYRDYIKHEDTLRGQRTASLLTIQGFLFGGLALLLNQAPPHASKILWIVRFVVPLVGAVVSLNNYMRYRAGDRSCTAVEDNFKQLKADLNSELLNRLPSLRYGTESKTDIWIKVTAYQWTFLAAWAVILVALICSVVRSYPVWTR